MNRRRFVRHGGIACAGGIVGAAGPSGLAAGTLLGRPADARIHAGARDGPADAYGRRIAAPVRLVVLHTNDTHSRLDPFPRDRGPFAGRGGAARRHTLVRRVRDANEHVLLLDSGDIFQGTPYFNYFGGEPEFLVMSKMGYDVATLGNHDFDAGVDGLVKVLPKAAFQFVSANYDFTGSALDEWVEPYVTRNFGGVKVGIFGLGIAFAGLVLARLHEGVTYRDPVETARTTARKLKEQGCAFVICLSHLGYRYSDVSRPSDQTIAAAAPDIDLVLGGHTHTFLDRPEVFPNESGHGTMVAQVGWGGMRLGRIDAGFDQTGRFTGWAADSADWGYDIDERLD